MVVFTCNNCGDSVNKPKVEKHMEYECKRKHFAVSFCCVDCLKDFNADTVKDHCQCVTEEQRYSAKGFVPKASSEKGKRKQAGWVDIVQSVINRKDLSNEEKNFLNIISKFDNVPRKKNKFQNFCFSTAPAYRKKGYLVDKVFDMIETEYKAQQTQNSNDKPVDTNKINTENIEKNDLIIQDTQKIKNKNINIESDNKVINEIVSNEAEVTQKKGGKKSKRSLDVIDNEIETKLEDNLEPLKKKKKEKKLIENNTVTDLKIKDENIAVAQIESSKKKNKKLAVKESDPSIIKNDVSKTENTNNNDYNVTNEVNEKTESQINKKENPTKKKKKAKVEELNSGIAENEVSKTESISNNENITNGFHNNIESQNSKKKKMKYQNELATVANDVTKVDKEPISKKKKRKLNDNEKNLELVQKILKTEEKAQFDEVQSGGKFDWNEAVNKILQHKQSKSMSLKKVMKRVISTYNSLNETTNNSNSELEKKCLKKLKKMKNVLIDNDKIHLVQC